MAHSRHYASCNLIDTAQSKLLLHAAMLPLTLQTGIQSLALMLTGIQSLALTVTVLVFKLMLTAGSGGISA